MTDLSSKIIERLKKEKVSPKPRWYFVLINGTLAAAIVASTILGSFGVAILIRHFTLADWEMAHRFSGSHIRSFFLILPYLWFIFIGFIILLSELLLKHTKKGYRVSSWKLVALSIGLSVLFGGICFFSEMDQPVEQGLRNNFGPYAVWQKKQNEIFVSPERGILAGRISEINSEAEWIIIDFRNNEWLVDVSDATIKGRFTIEAGINVGLIGKITSKAHFKADRVGPWRMVILPPPQPMIPPPVFLERNF